MNRLKKTAMRSAAAILLFGLGLPSVNGVTLPEVNLPREANLRYTEMKVHAMGVGTSANMLNRTFTAEGLIENSEFIVVSKDDYYIKAFVGNLESTPLAQKCNLSAIQWVVVLRADRRKLRYVSDGKSVLTPSGKCREAPGNGSLDILDYF